MDRDYMDEDPATYHVPRVSGRRSVAPGEPFYLPVIVHHGTYDASRPYAFDFEMGADNYIESVSVGDGEREYVVAEFVPESSVPFLSLPVRLHKSTILRVRACCSKHGCWETEWAVEVGEPRET